MDGAGNFSATSAPLAVTLDTTHPMVTGVTASTSDAIIGAGAAITLILALSEPVLVDESGGAPTLALNNGGVATYASGSGTSSLVLAYPVSTYIHNL